MSTESSQQQALKWQVTLWSGEVTPAEWSAFNTWLQAKKEHQLAWDWLQRMNQPLEQIPNQLASTVLRETAVSHTRRKLLLSLGVMGSLTALGYGAQHTTAWQTAMADISTKTGERRTITLPDGTQLTLNTDTAIDVNYGDVYRTIRLFHGEVMISTATDPLARPFHVATQAGVIRPIGTRFSVRALDDTAQQTQVNVYEGAVEIHAKTGLFTQLNAGEKQTFSAGKIHAHQPLNANSGAWEQGRLIIERETLAAVIAELRRYRSGILRCDPAVANLIVSGVYPLDDTDAILQSLQQGLPIKVSQLTRYWVTVSAP